MAGQSLNEPLPGTAVLGAGTMGAQIANPCTPVRFRYSPPFNFNDLGRYRHYADVPFYTSFYN